MRRRSQDAAPAPAPAGPLPAEGDLPFAGLVALGRHLRDRSLSPAALADLLLARLAARADLGCAAALAPDRARADARAAAAELAEGRWRGPLHGVPVLLADAVDTKGIPTALGLAALAARAPERDATVAARLAEQGAVLLGKARVAPLAGALPWEGPPCASPWEPGRALGGASPGAAAAVAAGLVPFALAVTGAEPDAAAACGVTALRPTYGVLSRAGVTAASFTLAAVGPVARSAEEVAVVLDALAGADVRDPSSTPAPLGLGRAGATPPLGLRVGLLEVPGAEPAERDAALAVAEALRGAGALVAPAALPALPWVEVAALLGGAEAEALRAEVAPGAPPVPGPAAAAAAADYVRAARVRGEGQRALGRLLAAHDLLLAPAPAGPGPDALAAAVALGGLPAVTFPAGLAGGRPAAARLVAPPFEEARALAAVALFQARTSHHLQRPPEAAPAAALTRR